MSNLKRRQLRGQLSKKLKTARIAMDLSQDALAQEAGLERKTINRIENGHFSPSVDSLFRLCMALEVSPSELFKGIK
jgi:putative transcriptional regulator